jgi:hypothetical protein
LHPINAIHAVDEQNQNEDESDLHSVLEFCYDGRLADEGEHLPPNCERQRNDEEHEERHLCYEEHEDLLHYTLAAAAAAAAVDELIVGWRMAEEDKRKTNETIVERHLCGFG